MHSIPKVSTVTMDTIYTPVFDGPGIAPYELWFAIGIQKPSCELQIRKGDITVFEDGDSEVVKSVLYSLLGRPLKGTKCAKPSR